MEKPSSNEQIDKHYASLHTINQYYAKLPAGDNKTQKQSIWENPVIKRWLESPECKAFLEQFADKPQKYPLPMQEHKEIAEKVLEPHKKQIKDPTEFKSLQEKLKNPAFKETLKERLRNYPFLYPMNEYLTRSAPEYCAHPTGIETKPAPKTIPFGKLINEDNSIKNIQKLEHEQKAKQVLKEGNIDTLVLEFETFAKNCAVPQDIVREKIKAFVKTEHATNKDLDKYTILKDGGIGYSQRFGGIYHDGQYSFVLCYDSVSIATISFHPEEGAIKVYQIQGVFGEKENLKKIKWERMLLTLVCDWAQENGIKEVQVQPKKSNKWERLHDEHTAHNISTKVDLELTNIVKNQTGAYVAQIQLKRYEGIEESTEIKGLEVGEEETFVCNNRLHSVSILEINEQGTAANICFNEIVNRTLKINGNFLYDITAKNCKFKYDKEKQVYRKQITPKQK